MSKNREYMGAHGNVEDREARRVALTQDDLAGRRTEQ
jgi:hypothetical protein